MLCSQMGHSMPLAVRGLAYQKEVVHRLGSSEDTRHMSETTAAALGIESGQSKKPSFLIQVRKGYVHMALEGQIKENCFAIKDY